MARWLLGPVLRWRSERIGRAVGGLLGTGEKVLDCGTGDGMVARAIVEKSGCGLTGVDTLDYGDLGIPFVLYDGRSLPFADGSFETALLLFVLHHCDDPDVTLAECRRVARRRLVVVEEVYTNRFGELFTKWEDWLTNRLLSGKVRIPFRFRTREGWARSFAALGLRIAEEKCFRPLPFIPLRTILFVLEGAERRV